MKELLSYQEEQQREAASAQYIAGPHQEGYQIGQWEKKPTLPRLAVLLQQRCIAELTCPS